jgi:tripeptide aminopeptidase
VRRASEEERAWLNQTFAALCRIRSPSGDERACADAVIAELRAIGLEPSEDGAGPQVGSNAGNVLVRVPGKTETGKTETGKTERSVLLCAHLDTVPPRAPIEPQIVNGGWENANDGILGADNKAAVAVILTLLRRLQAQPAEVGVEALFTVSEENGLRGASAFDVTQLRSDYGYVFDHATAIGEIVIASPSYHRVIAEFIGRAAHAGIRPEDGRSAIRAAAHGIAALEHGRLDAETTVNVGTITGGTAANVVAECCRLEAEVRSIDEARAEAVVTQLVDRLHDAAGAGECDLDVELRRMFTGYRLKPGAGQIKVVERALRSAGYEPRHITSGGGSDANAFMAAGFACANIADGTQHNHEPGERVSVDALEGMLEVAIAIIEEAAAV